MKGLAIVAQRQDEFGQTSTSRFILRVLIFGSLLIALNCYWIISAENRVVWELTDFSVFPTSWRRQAPHTCQSGGSARCGEIVPEIEKSF